MLTADRFLPLRAAASAASSFVRALWLNDSEPFSETGAAAELLEDAELLLALLAAVLAGADELLLDEEEQAVSAASAPAVTARPAAIFLFIEDLLGCCWEQGLDKRRRPLMRCSRWNFRAFVVLKLFSVIAKLMSVL
jgi:hypothetical protein